MQVSILPPLIDAILYIIKKRQIGLVHGDARCCQWKIMSFSCFYIEKLEKGDSTKLAGSYIYCSSRSVHSHTEIDNRYGCMFEALTEANINFLVSLIRQAATLAFPALEF